MKLLFLCLDRFSYRWSLPIEHISLIVYFATYLPVTDQSINRFVFFWTHHMFTEKDRQKYGIIQDWDVSHVTDMSRLFWYAQTFNDDISRWNVSNVTNMRYMFCGAKCFNQPIENWDVRRVVDMTGLFSEAFSFNQPIGKWNVSNVRTMSYMFRDTKCFNQSLEGWNTSQAGNRWEIVLTLGR